MILNRTFSFLFVHVPKSAGTSISARLSEYTRIGDMEIGGTRLGELIQPEFRRRFGLHKHSIATEIKEKLGEEFNGLFKFGFVRDPYSRAESLYRFIRSWEGPNRSRVRAMSFEAFLESDLVAGGKYDICRPQSYWLCDSQGAVIVDYVGRVETAEKSMDHIIRWFDPSSPARQLGKQNVSSERHIETSSEALRLIEEIYEDDFKVFDYERAHA